MIFKIATLILSILVAGQFFFLRQSSQSINKINGKPDLNGVWQVLNSANYDLEAHPAQAAMSLVDGPVQPIPHKKLVALGAVGAMPAGHSVVEGGEIPYQPWARKQKEENKKNWLEKDPEIKCYLPGVPRATYLGHAFQIFQSQKSMLFAYEFAGAVRDISLKKIELRPLETWMGQSYGYWDGDVFVIKTSGFNGKTWLDRSGNFHSDQLEVTERLKLVDKNHISYEATLTDSKVFTRPWKIKMTLYKKTGEDNYLKQFKCVEFVEELMYGHLRSSK